MLRMNRSFLVFAMVVIGCLTTAQADPPNQVILDGVPNEYDGGDLVGTQTTFPFGTPDDMRARVRDLAESLDAGRGGLMLSPTHVLEPEVPPENVIAFFEGCDRLVY